jgi:hypothetical protein
VTKKGISAVVGLGISSAPSSLPPDQVNGTKLVSCTCEIFAEQATALLRVDTECWKLDWTVTGSHAEQQAATTELIDAGCGLGGV